jgi:hypothetical protein
MKGEEVEYVLNKGPEGSRAGTIGNLFVKNSSERMEYHCWPKAGEDMTS